VDGKNDVAVGGEGLTDIFFSGVSFIPDAPTSTVDQKNSGQGTWKIFRGKINIKFFEPVRPQVGDVALETGLIVVEMVHGDGEVSAQSGLIQSARAEGGGTGMGA